MLTRTAAGVLALVFGVAMLVSGCASPGSTTCADYAAKDSTQQMMLVRKMIIDHDLDPESNPMAMAKIAVDVDDYCGIKLGQTSATKNESRGIDGGVDWSSYGG